VKDEKHWKNIIKKILPITGLDLDLITEAVMFFTSTMTKFDLLADGKVLVEADGYFLGPAGDR